MKLVRAVMILAGVAMMAVGILILRKYYTTDEQFVGLGKWLISAVVLHDGVLVPLTLAVGTGVWWLTRRAPSTVRQVIMTGFITAGVLALVAWPMIHREGKSANPTVLTQSYGHNLLWLLLAVTTITAGTATVIWLKARSGRRLEGE